MIFLNIVLRNSRYPDLFCTANMARFSTLIELLFASTVAPLLLALTVAPLIDEIFHSAWKQHVF